MKKFEIGSFVRPKSAEINTIDIVELMKVAMANKMDVVDHPVYGKRIALYNNDTACDINLIRIGDKAILPPAGMGAISMDNLSGLRFLIDNNAVYWGLKTVKQLNPETQLEETVNRNWICFSRPANLPKGKPASFDDIMKAEVLTATDLAAMGG